jgi:hypothetical protein
MKRLAFVLLLPVLFLAISARHLTSAASSGPGVSGTFQFSTDSGQTSNIDFNVSRQMDGSTLGEMTFAQDRLESDQNSKLEEPLAAPSRFFLKAQFDCLLIQNNKAVMSGTVSEANIPSYIGRRVLLAVEDNSQSTNGRKQDRLTWGLYRIPKSDWLPSDAERSDDQPGVAPTWLAQDAERNDDAGMLSNQSNVIGCQSYPISAFTFMDEKHGHGKVHVNP